VCFKYALATVNWVFNLKTQPCWIKCLYIYICIFRYCDLSYYVSCVGNPDMIWFDMCKTQDTGSTEGSHGDV